MEFLDSRLFPAFLAATDSLNFTRAAESLSTTQSNISQQIQKLERQVGTPLFVRVNKKISISEAGLSLREYIARSENALQELKENIGVQRSEPVGWVRYGMPHSCLFTPHFEMLLKAQKDFPKVRLDVKLIPNEEIVEQLLKQELDFGFLTAKTLNPGIAHEYFATEEYVLVAKRGYFNNAEPLNLESLEFVDHPGFSDLFSIWRNVFAPRNRKTNYESLNVVGRISSLSGAITMLLNGNGASIVPRHVVARELDKRQLEIHPETCAKSATSEIWIGMLQDRKNPLRVRQVLETFRKMKKPN
jgi:DNA-binding transcriptional LysR family regulator